MESRMTLPLMQRSLAQADPEIAAAIAREDPACSIAAMRRGGKANDPYPRLGITETRHRLSPIIPIEKRATLLAGDAGAI